MYPTTLLAALSLVSACLLPVLARAQASAQAYPSRPIQFIVPSTPGTTADQLARLLGPRLSQRWGVPVVVDNKVGAGGAIGFEAAAKAPPDGYTYLFSATAFSTLPALRSKLPYDPVKGFASVALLGASPLALLGASPLALVVSNGVPAKTARELVAYVRAQPPGKLNYASPGVGSVHHLTMEMFKQHTGMFITHIPYKGTGGALTDLAAVHVEASIVTLQTALPLVQSGKMRMLAVTGARRSAQVPNVPTLAEAGYPQVVSQAWFGIAAPFDTPHAVLAKMNAEVNVLLALPEVKTALVAMGVDAVGGKPEQLDTLVRSELAMWAQTVKTGGITAD
jgi:tripartite-type tricarboxylate transporter receptor subunit TctC